MSNPAKLFSQINGSKSPHPVTNEGKARVGRNATRHGLLSRTVVLRGEEAKDFELLLDQHVARFQPNDDLEHQAVEDMAICQWRLRRLHIIEITLMNRLSVHQSMANASRAQGDPLSCLERYESRLTRRYHRSFRHFQELRKLDPVGSFGKNSVVRRHQTQPEPQPTTRNRNGDEAY